MKVINNRMIFCMLTALQVYGASIQLSDESVAGVFRVRNQAEIEGFQTKLRHVLKQKYELRVCLEGLVGDDNCFVNSNPENEDLIGDIGLTFDQRFVDSMGEEYSKVRVVEYEDNRYCLTNAVRSLRYCCSLFCHDPRHSTNLNIKNLRLVDEFLNGSYREDVCSLQDDDSLGCRYKVVCDHASQDPSPHDLMCRWENFLKALKKTKRLLDEHIVSILDCQRSVEVIDQYEVSHDQRRSDLSKLCEKSKLTDCLQEYKVSMVMSLSKPISQLLKLLAKSIELKRFFRSKENPLVVLQEECAHLNLEERLKNVRDNLDEFIQMEREISTRLEKLARCAPFFIEYDFAGYVRRFPQLGMNYVDLYDQVLRRQLAEFISAEDLLRRLAEGNFSDIVKAQKVLHDDGDIVLPPIQVTCDFQKNDLCGNLDIFIKILKEIELWEARQSRQKESLQRSVFGVVCDQTAEATLRDQFPYIQQMKRSLIGDLVDAQNERGQRVDGLLSVCSEFWKLISALETLQNPEDQSPEDQILRLLDLWSKYLEQNTAFMRDPLVLKKHCDNVICYLHQFLRMEDEVISRIERLSGCALFFLQHNIENDILWEQLRSPNVECYQKWAIQLFGLANQFIAEGAEYRRMRYRFRGYNCLPAKHADSDFNECGTTDWGCHLKNFIAILQDTQNWQAKQCSQGNLLDSSVFKVLKDQGAARALGYQIPDSTEQQCRLREYLNLIECRSKKIDGYLYAFLGFLNTRNGVVEAAQQAQVCQPLSKRRCVSP